MSTVDSISGTSTSATSSSGFGGLTTEDFLNIMLTELQAQDPLEPQDSQALLDQFSSLYQIESNTKTAESLDSLVKQNEFASASLLIGSLISGISLDNRRVADIVLSVSNTEDGPVLNLLDGSRVLFGNVDEIVGVVDFDDEDSDTTNDTDDDDTTDGTGETDAGVTLTPSVGDSGTASAGTSESSSGTHDTIDKAIDAIKEFYR